MSSLVACLIGWGCAPDTGRNPLADVIKRLTPPSPSQAARQAFNVYDADTRRDSIALLSAAPFGDQAPYLRLYRLLMGDPDPTVRAACVKALGLHGTVDDAPTIVAQLSDPIAFVRWEAAKALQKIHHPDAVSPLINSLGKDQDPDVRMAAAVALGQYPQPSVFHALVGALEDPSFSVVWASEQSLATLTGRDEGADGARWLQWAAPKTPQELFKDQQVYVWRPYTKPRTLADKVKFWKKPAPATPRVPTGAPTDHPQGPTPGS